MERWIKIALGCGLLYYGVLQGARGLVIGVQNFAFRAIDLATNTVSLYLNLKIKNPLLVGLTIKGIQGDVYAQGLKIGYVNTTYDYYLGGGRTHILPVVVNLELGEMGSAAMMNIQSGNIQTLSIGFNGRVYVGDWRVSIPLQFELNYKDLVK